MPTWRLFQELWMPVKSICFIFKVILILVHICILCIHHSSLCVRMDFWQKSNILESHFSLSYNRCEEGWTGTFCSVAACPEECQVLFHFKWNAKECQVLTSIISFQMKCKVEVSMGGILDSNRSEANSCVFHCCFSPVPRPQSTFIFFPKQYLNDIPKYLNWMEQPDQN